jgi:hypothetical protein
MHCLGWPIGKIKQVVILFLIFDAHTKVIFQWALQQIIVYKHSIHHFFSTVGTDLNKGSSQYSHDPSFYSLHINRAFKCLLLPKGWCRVLCSVLCCLSLWWRQQKHPYKSQQGG